MTNTSPTKSELRREARLRRKAVPPGVRQAAGFGVISIARKHRLLRRGRKIAAYVPYGSEFPIWPLVLAALQSGCSVYLPVVPRRGKKLAFVRFDHQTRWQTGAYGIPQPRHSETCNARDLDQVLVPLLAFDHDLYRLGQGGGFYDTTFAFRRARKTWRKPQLTGVAYARQQFPHIPCDRWDLQLDQVLTENGLIRKIRTR